MICTYEPGDRQVHGGREFPDSEPVQESRFSPDAPGTPAGIPDLFPGLLARISFSESTRTDPRLTCIHTGLQLLNPETAVELLQVDAPARRSVEEGIYCAEAGGLLLLAMNAPQPAGEPLAETVQHSYQQLLQLAHNRGCPYLVRIWNYLPRINETENGEERYRDFCVGRAAAFDAAGIAGADYPSACALGIAAGDLVIYLLASQQRPRHFENPRQTSAWQYPREYGPRSPTFARATLLDHDGGSSLFVSGTASVIGHATWHAGDIAGQLQVTLENIDRLLLHVRETLARPGRLQVEVLKVYLRRRGDLELVRAGVRAHFGAVPAVFVVADICRSDLLLEMDGVWRLVS